MRSLCCRGAIRIKSTALLRLREFHPASSGIAERRDHRVRSARRIMLHACRGRLAMVLAIKPPLHRSEDPRLVGYNMRLGVGALVAVCHWHAAGSQARRRGLPLTGYRIAELGFALRVSPSRDLSHRSCYLAPSRRDALTPILRCVCCRLSRSSPVVHYYWTMVASSPMKTPNQHLRVTGQEKSGGK